MRYASSLGLLLMKCARVTTQLTRSFIMMPVIRRFLDLISRTFQHSESPFGETTSNKSCLVLMLQSVAIHRASSSHAQMLSSFMLPKTFKARLDELGTHYLDSKMSL